MEFNKPIYICFIDLEKTFGNLDFLDILNILLESDVPTGIIRLIKDIYSNNFNQIRNQSELTEKVAITRGVREGDSLSPILFSIMIDKILVCTIILTNSLTPWLAEPRDSMPHSNSFVLSNNPYTDPN